MGNQRKSQGYKLSVETMKKPHHLWLLCILLSVVGSAVHANDVMLYTGEALVSDQSAEQRARALPAALANVLTKLSGKRSASSIPGLRTATADAAEWLMGFQYRQVQYLRDDGQVVNELKLLARFAPQPVERLLQRLNLPKWDTRRPRLALVLDPNSTQAMSALGNPYAAARVVPVETASTRGMSLQWADSSDGFGGSLVSSVNPLSGGGWQARWRLSMPGLQRQWNGRSNSLAELLNNGVHRAANEMAAVFSIAASDRGTRNYRMTVSNIQTSADYLRCVVYLEQLNLVNRLRVISAQAGEVEFNLEINASEAYLDRAIGAGRLLESGGFPGRYRFRGE